MSHIKEADAPKIMEMHYIDGIDFGILHKPFYPMPRQKKIPKIAYKKVNIRPDIRDWQKRRV